MSFKAEVELTESEGVVIVKVTRPGSFDQAGSVIDPQDDPRRNLIVFYTKGSGDPDSTEVDEYRTDVVDKPEHEPGTSFSAIVIAGTEVVARDRKRVRNGQVTEG